jgi:ATP-dependent RNA helicase DeaD
MSKFASLGLEEKFLRAISDLGFTEPSEVQEKTIPLLLSKETDLVSLAQTGTGKTAAFGFPLLQSITPESRVTQGLVLSPTRELCLQITNELNNYGKYVPGLHIVPIYGGASLPEQAKQIKRGAQVIVATPGRMKDMMGRGIIDISKIEFCILDEADEMLNMGFYEDIKEILADTPEDKSTWLFSATMPKEVRKIASRFMHKPVEITIGQKNIGAENVQHEYYVVNARDRYMALKRLADANPDIFSVVFCRTKRDTQKVAEKLIEDGYNAAAIHGDLSQNQRDLVMKSFRTRQIQLLVATDVAARGIDVDDITHVINYQLPDEIETYTHRSGRTGRAGKKGVSMVIASKSEIRKIRSIEKIIQKKFIQNAIPTGIEICEIQLFNLAKRIRDTDINPEMDPYLGGIEDILGGIDRETLVKKMFTVEFDRFFRYYQKAKDLNSPDPVRDEDHGDSVRFFISLGRKDDFNWMSLKDFLRDLIQLGKEDVYKVDVMNSFSFFNVDEKHRETVLQVFSDFKLNGRKVMVEVSKDGQRKQFEKKGKRSGKGPKGGRSPKKGKSFSSGSKRKDKPAPGQSLKRGKRRRR